MKVKSILCGLLCLCMLSGCSGQPEQTPTSIPEATTTTSKQNKTTTTETLLTTSTTEAEQTEQPTTTKAPTKTPTTATTKVSTQAPTQPPTKAPEKQIGTVKGCITYQYNEVIGTRGDVGADILLIPNDLPKESLSLINAITFVNLPDGCLHTEADGNGNYIFQNVPVGRYVLVIRSKNTRCDGNTFLDVGLFYSYFDAEGQERLLEGFENYESTWITVSGGEEVVHSHDFGYTYF